MTYLEAFFLLLCSVAVFALGIRLFKKRILVDPFFIFAFLLLSAAARTRTECRLDVEPPAASIVADARAKNGLCRNCSKTAENKTYGDGF